MMRPSPDRQMAPNSSYRNDGPTGNDEGTRHAAGGTPKGRHPRRIPPRREGLRGLGLPPEEDAVVAWKVASLREAGTHIMGRVTYQAMASVWPNESLRARLRLDDGSGSPAGICRFRDEGRTQTESWRRSSNTSTPSGSANSADEHPARTSWTAFVPRVARPRPVRGAG